jgi:hypothetical protein
MTTLLNPISGDRFSESLANMRGDIDRLGAVEFWPPTPASQGASDRCRTSGRSHHTGNSPGAVLNEVAAVMRRLVEGLLGNEHVASSVAKAFGGRRGLVMAQTRLREPRGDRRQDAGSKRTQPRRRVKSRRPLSDSGRLDDDQKGTTTVGTLGGPQRMLLAVRLWSRRPVARQIGQPILRYWADYIGPNMGRSQRVTTKRVLICCNIT